MQQFVKKIVDLMREEMLFSWQGGPIIMLQVIIQTQLTDWNQLVGLNVFEPPYAFVRLHNGNLGDMIVSSWIYFFNIFL